MSARILIVDDEPNIVLSLEFLLEQAGYEVAVARSGGEALETAASFAPDLVLLDVMLPEMSGFEICRRLREDPRHEGLKIVMLTAKGREAEVEKGLQMGADRYVLKPFSTRELMDEVRRLLS